MSKPNTDQNCIKAQCPAPKEDFLKKYLQKLFKSKSTKIIIALFGTILIALPFILYLSHFHNGFSTQSDDWGNFGDFLGGFFTMYTAILMVVVVYLTRNLTNQDREKEERRKAIKKIYNQVVKTSDKPTPTNVSDLQVLTHKCGLYIEDSLQNKLTELSDIFLNQKDSNGFRNEPLYETVITDLKNCYNE